MNLPVIPAQILLPKKNIDMTKWAVVACDQHTSDPGYWVDLKKLTDGSYSALNLILPECYLNDNRNARIDDIAKNMNKYLADGIFDTFCGYVYVERTLGNGRTRKGIVAALDLESYSFIHADKALTRASEGTILERLPPRVQIRTKSPLELPHIMVLIDDKQRSCIEKIDFDGCEPLYDFSLNKGGGRIRGGLIKNSAAVESALNELIVNSKERYNESILFAVGDGNHSLAAAKSYYESQRAKHGNEILCRYALVEIVNIYDDALDFEPIHRLVSGVDAKKLTAFIQSKTKKFSCAYKMHAEKESYVFALPENSAEAVATLETIITDYIKENGGEIDYIHGDAALKNFASEKGKVGIELKSMNKSELFPYVVKYGALPKKMFSMGHAEDKRYYLEARLIR